MEDPQAQKEATRQSVSLFARKNVLNQHKEQLEANAHMIGGSLTVTYVFPQYVRVKISHPHLCLPHLLFAAEQLTTPRGMRSSVCVFSASRKAGNPVAVVLDPTLDYTVHVMAKIAERCVEPLVVVVQPGKKSSRYSLRLSVLTPGRHVPLDPLIPGYSLHCAFPLGSDPGPAVHENVDIYNPAK